MSLLWFELTATVDAPLVDAVSAIMRDVAPGGVSVEEPVDLLGPEKGFRVRGGEPVLVRAYLPASELGAVLTEDLRRAMEAHPSVELVARPIYEQDWAVSWREFFGVVETGGRTVIVPSWIEHQPKPDQIVIRLDPGQAFGTGHHETTRLCLAAIERRLQAGARVLDVGTGSGVLSIAAALLGAGPITAIDIDPVAADVARANSAENGVADRIAISAGRLQPDHSGTYDLVVSNISTEANTGLLPAFADVVQPGGCLVLSGILDVDAHAVADTAVALGFRVDNLLLERDWALIELTRLP